MPEGGVGEEKEEVSHGQIHPLKTTIHKIKKYMNIIWPNILVPLFVLEESSKGIFSTRPSPVSHSLEMPCLF